MRSYMLKYALFIACFLCLLPVVVKAEDEPRMEVFTGYSYMKSNHISFSYTKEELAHFNGLNISTTVNLMKYLGVTFDYSFHHDSNTDTYSFPIGDTPQLITSKQKVSYNTFLLGPTFKDRHKYFEPFAHALFGVVKKNTTSTDSIDSFSHEESTAALAFALGGGFDIKIHKNISIRAAQLDYMFFGYASALDRHEDHNMRLSTGVVFTF